MKYLPTSKRTKTLCLFFLCYLLTTSNSYAQWESKDTGVNVGLFDIHFVNEDYGWAVGDSGAIIRTTDGGDNWELQRFKDPPATFRAVYFADTTHGWVVGGGNTILRTNDGGATWSEDFWSPFVLLSDVYFLDTSNGWVVGALFGGGSGVILKTTDGGVTWNNTIDSSGYGYQGVYFVSEHKGWAVGAKGFFDNFDPDIIVHTTNGGSTWTEQTTPTEGPLYRVVFVNETFGWAGGSSFWGGTAALKTTDGGINWLPIEFQQGPGSDTDGILNICAPDPWNVWIVRGKSVYRSMNGGATFSRFDPDSSSRFLSCAIKSGVGWISGSSGTPPDRVGRIWKYISPISSAPHEENFPIDFALYPNYPNPFNPSTQLRHSIKDAGYVSLKVYDLLGREVAVLVNEEKQPGAYNVEWNAGSLPSGMYFSRLESGGRAIIQKLLLVR